MSTDDQIRVRFTTKSETYRVTEAPFAVPLALDVEALNEVISHLSDKATQDKIVFNFFIDGHLLQTSLQKYVQKHNISSETVLDVEYSPRISAPQLQGGIDAPDWISAIDATEGIVFAGTYDGTILSHALGGNTSNENILQHHSSIVVHEEPITALRTIQTTDGCSILSGSKDGIIRTCNYDAKKRSLTSTKLRFDCASSVSSLATTSDGSVCIAGTWDGNIQLWSLDHLYQPKDHPVDQEMQSQTLEEDHHQGNVSGLAWTTGGILASGSWDHSVRTWDINDQIRPSSQRHCSKVITTMTSSPFASMVATGHPDGSVRLWDCRSGSGKASEQICTVLSGQKEWISDVSWSKVSQYVFVSSTHNGNLIGWDIRATSPVFTCSAHTDKALAIHCEAVDGRDIILSGGSDKQLKQFSV